MKTFNYYSKNNSIVRILINAASIEVELVIRDKALNEVESKILAEFSYKKYSSTSSKEDRSNLEEAFHFQKIIAMHFGFREEFDRAEEY